MLTITEKAAARAREVLTEKGFPQGGLRVFVVGGGCAGYQYGMALTQHAEQDDVVVEQQGLKLVVSIGARRISSLQLRLEPDELLLSAFVLDYDQENQESDDRDGNSHGYYHLRWHM